MTPRWIIAALFAGLAAVPAWAQSAAYCNITSVQSRQLSNGVQVTIRADGVLRYRWDRTGGGEQTRVYLRFQNAKSTIGKTFIDVSKFPVSYVQLSVPPDALEGVGVNMNIAMYEPARANVEQSPDQQSIIVTVNSARATVRRGAATAVSGAATDKTMDLHIQDGRMTISAVKAKVSTLLAGVAQRAGLNIAVDDSLRDREVSLTLDDIAVTDGVRAIAGAAGLALAETNGVWMVSDGVPSDLATYRLAATESFRMKYTKAQAASGLLPTFLYSYLHVNEAQNAVVVTAPAEMLDKIRADFRKIDIAPPQIMIEALAVEVSSTEDLNAGLGLSARNNNLSLDLDPAEGDISYRTVGALPGDFQARLRALVAQGKADIRANPRMAAVNGQNANIFIGQTRFIKVKFSSGGVEIERIQGVDIGVKLNMRSWTGGNGEITVTLEPEVSNISELERETGLPVLSTREAETTVRVKDGETIMIGGLDTRQEYQTKTKIPVLGDLPLVGRAFRTTKTTRTGSELVIFVTPHILTDRGRLKDEAREQTLRERFK